MERKADWEDQLHRYFESVADEPHVYGAHDCMIHSAAAIDAQTGTDLAAGHRGKYDSPTKAVRYLKKRGFASPEAMIDSLLPERPVGFARRGDIVLVGGIPGVCWGEFGLFVGMQGERDGLVRRPRDSFDKAWGVGE